MSNPNRDPAAAKIREENAAWLIENITGRQVALMPDEYSPFDYMITKTVRGHRELTAIAEFRSRPDVARGQYETIVLNVAKTNKIIKYAALFDVIGIFIVKWSDTGPMYLKIPEKPAWSRRLFERKDPRPQDVEEYIYDIPVGEFKEL